MKGGRPKESKFGMACGGEIVILDKMNFPKLFVSDFASHEMLYPALAVSNHNDCRKDGHDREALADALGTYAGQYIEFDMYFRDQQVPLPADSPLPPVSFALIATPGSSSGRPSVNAYPIHQQPETSDRRIVMAEGINVPYGASIHEIGQMYLNNWDEIRSSLGWGNEALFECRAASSAAGNKYHLGLGRFRGAWENSNKSDLSFMLSVATLEIWTHTHNGYCIQCYNSIKAAVGDTGQWGFSARPAPGAPSSHSTGFGRNKKNPGITSTVPGGPITATPPEPPAVSDAYREIAQRISQLYERQAASVNIPKRQAFINSILD